MANIDDVMDEVMNQTLGELSRVPFYCVHCGDQHASGEPGFRFPDRVFGLDVTPERREELCAASDENTFEMDGMHFVRGVLHLPVHEEGGTFGIGLWVQLEKQGARTGRIANQTGFLAPTLGVAATLKSRGPDWRPDIVLADHAHPLARAQRDGIDHATVVRWMSDEVHADEGRPNDEPFEASLATHGWEILDPATMAKTAVGFLQPPREGDTVKVTIRFLGTDATGSPAAITAGWWLRITDASRPDVWGTTLASIPRVPATLMFGSPVWVRREQVLQHAEAE